MSAAAAAAAAAAVISSSYSTSTSSNTISNYRHQNRHLCSPNYAHSYSFHTTNQLFRLSRYPLNGAAPEARVVSTRDTVKSAPVADLDTKEFEKEKVTLARPEQTLRIHKEESKVGRWRKVMNRCVMLLRWRNVKRMRKRKVVVSSRGDDMVKESVESASGKMAEAE